MRQEKTNVDFTLIIYRIYVSRFPKYEITYPRALHELLSTRLTQGIPPTKKRILVGLFPIKVTEAKAYTGYGNLNRHKLRYVFSYRQMNSILFPSQGRQNRHHGSAANGRLGTRA